MKPGTSILLAAVALTVAMGSALASNGPDTLETRRPGVLELAPASADSQPSGSASRWHAAFPEGPEWSSVPFGERLLSEPRTWRRHHPDEETRLDPVGDYNRVDGLRLGLAGEAQNPSTMLPRVGGRIEYAFGRKRTTYGVQLEQPLAPLGRIGVGVSASRRTDHSDLQQVDDFENSMALLFARQDYRDYFEREGFGAYLVWRVPDFSRVSVHVRNDTYRSLRLRPGTYSLFFEHDRDLRVNPEADEGDCHAVLVRLEHQARRRRPTRAGLYHWVEIERAGAGLGGDFAYTRALADVRSVLRLTPGTTLVLRGAAGSALAGELPAQRQFTLGGVDGLRAHAFAQYRGNQLLLGQAEYTAALPLPTCDGGRAGLHAIVFADAGRAWDEPSHAWAPGRQHFAVDGGLGLTTSEDNMRIYVARDLQRPRASAVFGLRLQRPF